jgi:hypothetical protein
MFIFGSGNVYGVRTDISNPTPVQFGTLQEVSVDFEFSQKDLTGQYQFPVASARTGGKITGKAKAATITMETFNNFYFGQTIVTGSSNRVSAGEAAMVAASSPYTATAANSATFTQDLGVTYASSGARLTRVASAPTVGQYTVAAGVYTFSAADEGAAILLNYEYTSATTGNKIIGANQLMGTQPVFKVVLNEVYLGKALTLELNQCISTKLSLDFKNEDWTIPEFDFGAFADSSNNVYTISLDDL